MSELKYKVGDKVRIKNIDWYNENRDILGHIDCGNVLMTFDKARFCGKIVTIFGISDATDAYRIEEDNGLWNWTDEMIEELVEEEISLDKAGQITDFEYEELTYTLPDGYQFKDENGNVINATKIVLEKKKKPYPNTYEECYHIIELSKTSNIYGYKNGLLFSFQKLLIARDAYWKIAGEEMGLDKPWEPDCKNGNQKKYCIYNYKGEITKGDWFFSSSIFAFPIPEMRDAFKENFDQDLEICKELL